MWWFSCRYKGKRKRPSVKKYDYSPGLSYKGNKSGSERTEDLRPDCLAVTKKNGLISVGSVMPLGEL